MPAWYDISGTLATQMSLSDLENSTKRVHKHIKEEAEILQNNYSRIFLGGFSQGASLALYSGLMYGDNIGGICACSGSLLEFLNVATLPEKRKLIPILLYHGVDDPMVNFEYSNSSYDSLIRNEFNIELHKEEGLDHGISLDELEILKSYYSKYMI